MAEATISHGLVCATADVTFANTETRLLIACEDALTHALLCRSGRRWASLRVPRPTCTIRLPTARVHVCGAATDVQTSCLACWRSLCSTGRCR